MGVLIFSTEASVMSNGAEQAIEMSTAKRAFFEDPVPRLDWSDIGASDHFIQLYEEDAHLLDTVSRFTSTGLEAGEAVVVIATQVHRDHLEARCRAHGVDLTTMRKQGQYVPLDATETLAQFMVNGWPDPRRFAVARGVTLQQEGVTELGLVAFHANTLRRALLNLVQNALDAVPQGSMVTLAGQRTATEVRLHIQDTGHGIPAEQLGQIFEPLYTTKPGGTGLGLYIVQEIMTAHGGQVAVDSVQGQGTTFTLTLPCFSNTAPVSLAGIRCGQEMSPRHGCSDEA